MTDPVVRTDAGRLVLASSWLVAVAISVLLLPGCGGCSEDPVVAKQKEIEAKKKEVEEKKKDAAKKKKEQEEKDFEISSIMQSLPAGDVGQPMYLKPGHWYSAIQKFQRNKGDFQGELMSYVSARDGSMPLALDDTPYRLEQFRPVALAKKQAKLIEMMYYVPRKCSIPSPPVPGALPSPGQSKNIWLYNRLYERATGLEVFLTSHLFQKSPTYQYELLVLSNTPDRYQYVKTLPGIELKGEALAEESQITYYKVVMPKVDKRVSIPSHPLAWTAVAVILWDDLDPGILTPEQQDSLVDWLHWGGQIIVSGPNSIAALRGSFLGPFLPVSAGNPQKLTAEAFTEMNRTFSLRNPKQPQILNLSVVPGKEPEGLDFTLQGDGYFVPGTGKLVAERLVGRGRIAITSFSLGAREFQNWPHVDGFYNAVLLRRPARDWKTQVELQFPYFEWVDSEEKRIDHRLDPRWTTQLRYWSRDMGDFQFTGEMGPTRPPEIIDESVETRFGPPEGLETVREPLTRRSPRSQNDFGPDPHRGFQSSSDSGVAGWNDFSGVAHAARDALRDAAGIKVPERTAVIQMLLVYLAVLVPLNWGFFRLIGRVEWAWAAAPVIALAGAVGLVRMVQLDIGFVRSRHELGVLELQGSHARGHLTRYTALYTSLTTGYDNSFADSSALALPFSVGSGRTQRNAEFFTTVELRRDEGVNLRGFQVESNATGLIHSEQMLALGGSIELVPGERMSVKNGTTIPLQGAGLVRRNAEGHMEAAWIGDLKPGESRLVTFKAPSDERALLAEWEKSDTTRLLPPDGELSVRKLLDLAKDPRAYHAGDVRLLAWTSEEELGNVTYNPPASQNVVRTLVIANLRYAPLPPPQPDINTQAEKAQE